MKTYAKSILGLAAFVLLVSSGLNSSPAVGGDEEIAKLAKKVYLSVVRVEARNGVHKVATGVVIDKEGHIVTTALISPRDENVYVIGNNGKRIQAEFLGMDSVTHLAVVKAKGEKWNPIEWGQTSDVEPGSDIVVVSISPEDTPAVTRGIVSSLGSQGLRLNVWVVPGSSGSPVIDNSGKMVGLIRGSYSDGLVFSFEGKVVAGGEYIISREEAPSSALALAIPVDIVKKVSLEIKETGKVRRGWLGVWVGENEEGEIVVANVDDDSPAKSAGFMENDIILEFDGKNVTGGKMLEDMIKAKSPGDKVKIKINRDEKEKDIQVELGEYSDRSLITEFETKFPRIFPPKSFESDKAFPNREPDIFQFFQSSRNYIGVYLDELNPELAEYFGVKGGEGLLIRRVSEDSPAEKAGLTVGDVIVAADGKPVKSQSRLNLVIQRKKKGESVKLEIIRDKKKKTVDVEIGEESADGVKFVPFNSKVGITPFLDGRTRFNEANQFFFKWLEDKSKEKQVWESKMKETQRSFEEQMKSRQQKWERSLKDAEKLFQGALKRYRCIKV